MPGSIPEMVSATAMHGPPGVTAAIPMAALVAVISLGCAALLMLGIQPVVLGALQGAHRLSVPEMGRAATIETLALGAVSAAMAARLRHRHLRLWSLAGCLLLIAANAAGLVTAGLPFTLTRGLAGAAGGLIVWVAVGLITRRRDASRVNAVFLGAQALSQGAAAALIPLTIGPTLGANGGLWLLGGLAALTLPLILLIPNELPELPPEAHAQSSLHASSLSGLAASFFAMAGIVGLWVYVEPIAAARHISSSVVSIAIALSLAAQVVGAVIVVAGHRWLKPVSGLIGVAAAFIAVTAVFAWSTSQAAFFAATLVFGLLWTFALALGMPLLLAADPTRRATLYGPAITLLGASAGPLVAGAFSSDTDLTPALVIATCLFVLSAVAVAISAATRRPLAAGPLR